MRIQRSANVLDVMERVLDRGVVIEAWVGVSLAGIHLVDVEARVLVASIATYVKLADTVAATAPAIVRAPAAARPGGFSDYPRRRAVSRRRADRAALSHWLVCDQGCTFPRPGRRGRAVTDVLCPDRQGTRCSVALR
jgi:gas vesicle structural protein